jgi:hypothetical protein
MFISGNYDSNISRSEWDCVRGGPQALKQVSQSPKSSTPAQGGFSSIFDPYTGEKTVSLNNLSDPFTQEKTVSLKDLANPFTQTDSSSHKKAKPVAGLNAFKQENLNPLEASRLARNAFLNYFKNTFAETEQFKAVFGDQKWEDIADTVIYDLQMHRNKEAELAIYKSQAYVFTAEVAGMSGEVVLDKKSGTAKKICVDPT